MKYLGKVLLSGLCVLLSLPAFAQSGATMLLYKVWEQGLEPYDSRILVTEDYIRLDEPGAASGDYSLYDRKTKTIFNVSEEDQSIFAMKPPKPITQMPEELVLSIKKAVNEQAPTVAGKVPVRIQFLTNGKVCRESNVLNDFLVAEAKAMAELHQTLGWIQQQTINSVPVDVQTECDLSDIVYQPERGYQNGFVLSEQKPSKRQLLIDFKTDFELKQGFFELPENYKRMDMALF